MIGLVFIPAGVIFAVLLISYFATWHGISFKDKLHKEYPLNPRKLIMDWLHRTRR